MSKLILALAMVGLATTASAQTYFQGNIGASKLEAKDDFKFKDNSTAVRLAVGQDQGAVRYVGDYTYFGKIKVSDTDTEVRQEEKIMISDKADGEIIANSVGGSAIYDFSSVSGFAPYVGIRLGINQLKAKVTETEMIAPIVFNSPNASTPTPPPVVTTKKYSESKVRVGAGVVSGVQYQFNTNMAVDAGIEYNYLGKIEGTKMQQYGVNVGLRYNF